MKTAQQFTHFHKMPIYLILGAFQRPEAVHLFSKCMVEIFTIVENKSLELFIH
jgi:hypothetical protein